ncbi:M28 family peptidase [bacterium]|nr:M28 family peptidase [bacterium]
MKNIVALSFVLLMTTGACSQEKLPANMKPYMDIISPTGLSSTLHFLASDNFEGRLAGTKYERLAAEYLASCYEWMEIPPAKYNGDDKNPIENYFQPFHFIRNQKNESSQNVIAFIEGSDPKLKKEAVILIAHYDHLGKDTSHTGDQIFNGAADDGSGTVALLHIAKSFAEAKKNGMGPKRSILFLHTGAEEAGVKGSTYYVNYDPIWPLEETAAVINMDGVGGFDQANLPGNTNYVYLLHADSTSAHLFEKVKQLNSSAGINLDLLYPKNAARFRSDNEPFEAHLIPAIYFSSGLTEHYHKVSDEASTIDYGHMAKVVKLVFSLSWELSNLTKNESKFNRALYKKSGQYYCRPCGCGKDNIVFEKAGVCDACNMQLFPMWVKTSK